MSNDFSRIVVLESPYAGNVERNLAYIRAGMRDAFLRGELPIASHALYTQPGVLDDTNPKERALGIKAGFVVAEILHWCSSLPVARVFLRDLGMSGGMVAGQEHAEEIGMATESRSIITSGLVDWKGR